MRLSTAEFSRLGLNAILDQQASLLHTQRQLSASKRILEPADDPSGTALVSQLQTEIDRTARFQANGNRAEARLNLEETTLSSINDALQRIRQLVLQANNDSQTSESRANIAAELHQRLADIKDLANTRAANGEYLFAGYQSRAKPFTTDADGQVHYQGDDNQRLISIGADRSVADGDPGSAVFMNIAQGNGTFIASPGSANSGSGVVGAGSVLDPGKWPAATEFTISFAGGNYTVTEAGGGTTDTDGNPLPSGTFTPGQSISFNGIEVSISGQPADGDEFTIGPAGEQSLFQTVSDLADAIATPANDDASRAVLHNAVNNGLASLDRGLDHLLNVRAQVGARLNSIDNQNEVHNDWTLQLKTTKSSIEDLDYAEAITRFQRQLTGLQAAQLAYTKVQGLSLFDYIR